MSALLIFPNANILHSDDKIIKAKMLTCTLLLRNFYWNLTSFLVIIIICSRIESGTL